MRKIKLLITPFLISAMLLSGFTCYSAGNIGESGSSGKVEEDEKAEFKEFSADMIENPSGNKLTGGQTLWVNGILYYISEEDGCIYRNSSSGVEKLTDHNAQYLNYWNGNILYASVDGETLRSYIYSYAISSGNISQICKRDIEDGIKNVYVVEDTLFFQSDNCIYEYSLNNGNLSIFYKDGEISDFIISGSKLAYTKYVEGGVSLNLMDLKSQQVQQICENTTGFELNRNYLIYCDGGNLIEKDLETQAETIIYQGKVHNIIGTGDKLYFGDENNKVILSYDVVLGTVSTELNTSYTFFNVAGGEIYTYNYETVAMESFEDNEISQFSDTQWAPVTQYKDWKQMDPRWADIHLGSDGDTVKNIGCLVTSVAILIADSGLREAGEDFNPGTFAQSLSNNNGFTGGALIWATVEKVVPGFKVENVWISLTGNEREKINAIKNYISQGFKIVVRVVTSQHWVAVDDIEGDIIYMNDPASWSDNMFGKYSSGDTTRMAVFSTPNGNVSKDKVKKFVENLYEHILGRKSDISGIKYWTERLMAGSVTGAETAGFFIESQEFKMAGISNGVFIEKLYKAILGRDGDESGKRYWVSLLNKGATRPSIGAAFINSPEFSDTCNLHGIIPGIYIPVNAADKNINLTMFVTRCYKETLGRNPDERGLEYWTGSILNKSRTAQEVAKDVLYSNEFIDKNLSNQEFVKVLYKAFMGRNAGDTDLNYWVKKLDGGISRESVINYFGDCNEFWEILKSFGL